jgi:hypothetical protein
MYRKVKSIWKDVIVICFEVLHLEGVRKTTKDPYEHSLDSNKVLHKYKSGELVLCQPASLIS